MPDDLDARFGHDGAVDDLLPQLRLRARRLGALLDPGEPPDPRRSPLRAALLEDAWRRFEATDAAPRAQRRALTVALLAAWRAGRAAAAADDPFAARHLRRINRIEALEAGLPGDAALAWDDVLTVAELRPSAITDVGAALHQAAAQRADGGFRRRLLGVVAEAAAGDPGPWLRRAGVEDAQGAIAAFFERVEEAFFFVAAPDVALARARQAMENLRRWDAVLARLHGRLLARRDGEEAAQAVVARFLEPRIIAAYAPLPPDELERVALTAGRNLTLSTLAGPRETTLDDAPPLADDTPDVDERLATREQWRRLFTALRDVVDEGVLTAQELLFLWLAPALGAGEAWRVSGGDLARVASANYHHTRCMGLLHGRVGADSPWVRPPNPGRPDDRTRGLVGLLALRDGPDPYLEAAAGLPADARAQAPPPTDPELLTLLWLFNLGPDAYRGALPASWTVGPAGPLVARCLRLQRWEEARRGALARTLAAAGGADGEAPGSLDARSVAFLLATMALGLPSEASRALDAAAGGAPWALVVRAWLGADGPAHQVYQDLRASAWPVPAPSTPPPRRPVEREARLRQHLRSLGP
ncbi:MAG: hypothetical protein R3F60_01170 [bacterium]